jgi:NAD(P) transhydrogenase subunit alpha
MIVCVPTETTPGERRVALIPDSVRALRADGTEVLVQAGAGKLAGHPDKDYERAGASISPNRLQTIEAADVVVQVSAYSSNPHADRLELAAHRPGQVLIGMFDPLGAPHRVAEVANRGVTAFALELIPRITRAQRMDVLSSMAMLAGYRAAILAAGSLPRCFPMFMTAAGTVHPARVLVLGAGVAGLQAIATAKRLGAIVTGYDIRPEVATQVESVGGRFLSPDTALESDGDGYARAQDANFHERQRALLTKAVAASDVVITTAAIPGRRAPVLISTDMVRSMRPGSVIVDLAARTGGNCELTRPDVPTVASGVRVLGPTNIVSSLPAHASQLFARNVSSFIDHMFVDGELGLDDEDEIASRTLLCRDGEIVNERVRAALQTEIAKCS